VPYAEGSSPSGPHPCVGRNPADFPKHLFAQALKFSFSKYLHPLYSVPEAGSFSFIMKSKYTF